VNKPTKTNALNTAANEKMKHHKASLADAVPYTQGLENPAKRMLDSSLNSDYFAI
jgi:hypothetical protein